MICERDVKEYCSDDPSLIQNYELAIADQSQTWECHHRAEILPCGRYSQAQLKKHGLFKHVPASQLIFLTKAEHNRLHMQGKKLSAETRTKMRKSKSAEHRAKMSAAMKGKSPWIKGKHLSEETRAKLSEALKGKYRSAETKAKIAESKKGTHRWNNGVKNMYSVECPGDGWVPGFLPKKKKS